MFANRDYTLLSTTREAKNIFATMQREKAEEKKILATKLALNWLRLNRWDKSAADYAEIYQTAWIEKMMIVETAYSVAEIKNDVAQIKSTQQRLLADVGLIVDRTGQILQNQEVIIKQNGEILLIVKENLEVSYEILGNVKDIKASVEDMQRNGVIVKSNAYQGGATSYIKYLVIGGLILMAIVYIKRRNAKKGKK
jgi:hypothetical protein